MDKQKLPTQATTISPDRSAIAPYNFVPLPERIVPAEPIPAFDRYDADRYTGTIHCELTTASPLYIRCALTTAQFRRAESEKRPERLDAQPDWRQLAKNTPDFFYTNDIETPVIPGSSLRGMLRSLVEIVSYSKMSRVTDEHLFFRTVDDTSIGRAYGKRMSGKVRGGWLTLVGREATIKESLVYKVPRDLLDSLFPSGYYDGRVPNQHPKWNVQQHPVFIQVAPYRNAQEASFGLVTAIQLEEPSSNDWIAGRLIITGNIPKKKHEFVFIEKPNPKQWPVDEEIIRRFHDDDQITLWQREAFSKDKPVSANRLRKGMLPRGVPEPIFFLLSDQQGVVFFGRAGMFRLPYLHSPYDMLPTRLRLHENDLAEVLFGHVAIHSSDERKPIAGRISISDAMYVSHEEQLWLAGERRSTLTPRILSGPKPTSFQQYLVQRQSNKLNLAHYDETTGRTTLRGHKRYWHKRTAVQKADIEDAEFSRKTNSDQQRDTQHTQFRPVAAGVKFCFTIRFEQLSDIELGALLWVLRLGSNPDMYLSIGMGKSLGMGSIALASEVHSSQGRTQRYNSLLDDTGWTDSDSLINEQRCIDAFELHVLTHAGEEQAVKHLEDAPRIKELFTLLHRLGPTHEHNRYQHFDDFKHRPVLPLPTNVLAQNEDTSTTQTQRSNSAPQPRTEDSERNRGASTPQPVNTASATPALAGPQAIVEGEIGGVNDQQGQASVRVAGSILKNADNSRPRFVAALRGKLATGTRVRVRQLADGTWEIFKIIT